MVCETRKDEESGSARLRTRQDVQRPTHVITERRDNEIEIDKFPFVCRLLSAAYRDNVYMCVQQEILLDSRVCNSQTSISRLVTLFFIAFFDDFQLPDCCNDSTRQEPVPRINCVLCARASVSAGME